MSNTASPLVSVAILTRETPLMILKRCFQSIQSQTLSDLEIILLDLNDEGSLFKDAIQTEKDLLSDVIYLEYPEQKEFVHGKNMVLKNYHGSYLLFLSAQDTIPPKYLVEVLKVFQKDRSITVIDTDMAAQQSNILEHSDYELFSPKFQYLSQLVFHRDCFSLVGTFDENLIAHCDDDLWLRISVLHLSHHLSSADATIAVCPDCYQNFTPLESAIGYRQLLLKYQNLFEKKKQARKLLYQKAASAYQNAGVFHRYIQFKAKAIFTKG